MNEKLKNMSPNKFRWVVLITMLPVVLWPLMMTHVDQLNTGTERFLMLAMPVYVIASGYLAHYAYKERPEVSWILIVVNWLAYLAFLVFVYV